MKTRRRRYRLKRKFVRLGFGLLILAIFLTVMLVSSKLLIKNNQVKKESAQSMEIKKDKSSAQSQKLPQLTLKEEIGQVLMIGLPADGSDQSVLSYISKYQLGSVILTGRSSSGVSATRQLTDQIQALAPANRKLLIAADQEGGYVQTFQGPGFSTIPDGLHQGALSADQLKQSAQTWAEELAKAGVNFDLAPVADTVTSPEFAPQNAPIGYFGREYGYDSKAIEEHSLAFVQGMKQAQVLTTVKHFPGLGHVVGNTDTTANVTDTETTEDSSSVAVFKNLIDKKVESVMTSTTIYIQIDPKLPGAFSEKVVQGLLRDQLGFKGLVITDDLSNAAQVQNWTPGARAVLAIDAGNDIVLATAPAQISEMFEALLKKAESDQKFADKLHEASNRVLQAKENLKLMKS